jgi:hypothetical protein
MNTAVAAAAKTTLTASEDRANRADQSDKQTTDLLRLGREAAYFQGRDAVNDVMSSRLYDIVKATISGAVARVFLAPCPPRLITHSQRQLQS